MPKGVYIRTKKHKKILSMAQDLKFKLFRTYIKCLTCKKEIYQTQKVLRKYCSKYCYSTRNGNYHFISCLICGKQVKCRPSQFRKFCSKSCSMKCTVKKIDYSYMLGVNNPAKRPEVRKKISKALLDRKLSVEHRRNIGIAAVKSMKKLWQDKSFATKRIKKILKSLMKRPTSFEQKIILLCSKYKLPFIYTGDGRVLIGYKNPDFIDERNKIIIEVFLNYFKIRDYGSVENYIKLRGEHFAKYGYKTIFIKENEIMEKNWENVCLNKIRGSTLCAAKQVTI